MYGSGEENLPLPVDEHRLPVVGDRALHGGHQHGGRRRRRRDGQAQQGRSRPPPRHHSPLAGKAVGGDGEEEGEDNTRGRAHANAPVPCVVFTGLLPSTTDGPPPPHPWCVFCWWVSWILGFLGEVLGRSVGQWGRSLELLAHRVIIISPPSLSSPSHTERVKLLGLERGRERKEKRRVPL